MSDTTLKVQNPDELIAVIRTLLEPQCPNRSVLCHSLLLAPVLPQQLSAEQRQEIYDRIMPYVTQADFWRTDWEMNVFLSSLIQYYCDNKLGLQLYAYAFQQTASPQHRAELLYQIRTQAFAYNIDLGLLFQDLLFLHYQDWFHNFPAPPPFEARPDRAIILVSQLLAPPHAPTVDTYAKYHILSETFGYDVAIVNTNEAPAIITLPFLHSMRANRAPQFSGWQTGPEGCRIFTPPCDMPGREGYQAIVDFVARWQPAFILSFGICNFSAEYLGRFTKVITMPAGIELLATRNSFASVTFRPLTDGDHTMIRHCGMEKVRIINALYNYDKPQVRLRYSRADFRLTEEDFVIAVVGTRLAEELDEENIVFLQTVLDHTPQSKIVFLGEINALALAAIEVRLGAERTRFPGFVRDVPAFYEQIADLYLNPKRGGGGTSGAHALAFGVPAFTRAYGHVASLTHPDFVFERDEELLAAIVAAAKPQNRASLRQKALEGFARVGSRERMLRTILTAADVPTDMHPAPVTP